MYVARGWYVFGVCFKYVDEARLHVSGLASDVSIYTRKVCVEGADAAAIDWS